MKITIEISLYPLNENFKYIINNFIYKLKNYKNISILTNNVSTQISGEYEEIFDLMKNEFKEVFENHKAVFVVKFLNGDKIN